MVTGSISSFADCGSNTVSIRIPNRMLVDILVSLPESDEKEELVRVVQFSARRCKELAEKLKENNLL